MPQATPVLDPTSRDPLWLQIALLIEAEVSGGVLTRGSRLPSERELCERFGVSRVTLRRALSHLVEEGVLESSHGRGWYVTTGVLGEPPNMLRSFSQTAAARGLQATARVLAAETIAATLDEAEALAIAPGADVFHLRRVRLLGGAPIAFDHARLPLELAPDLAELEIEPGHPLLVTDQITFDQNGQPMELATMAYRYDRYRFRASLRRPGKERR